MARKLSDNEFFEELAKLLENDDPEEVKAMWRRVQDYIAKELRIYGFCRLPYFGELKANQAGGHMRWMPVSNKPEDAGKTHEMYIEPYLLMSFRPSQRMKDLVNGKDVSREQIFKQREEYRRKKKEEELFKKQQECMERAAKALELAEARRKKNIEQREKNIETYRARHQRKQANDWFSDDDFKE